MPRRVKSMAELAGPYTLKHDPFKTVPFGWRCPRYKYTVKGFCSRRTILGMMAMVLYDGSPAGHYYDTTRDYLTVLQDYKEWTETLPIGERLLALGHKKRWVNLLCKDVKWVDKPSKA